MEVPSTMKELTTLFEKVVHLPETQTTVMNSVNTVVSILNILLLTDGAPGWRHKVNKILPESQALSEKDETLLQPLVRLICGLPSPTAIQHGGDINGPYYDLVNSIKDLDAGYAARAPIYRMEQKGDDMDDMKPFKLLQFPLDRVSGPLMLGTKLSEVPVPFRLFVSFGHTLLDILRLMVSLPGADMPLMRKLFSLALAVLEFMRGEWKQAILSLAGFYDQFYMYAGFFGKVFLNIVSLLSPDLQDSLAYGPLILGKSLLIGTVLKLFQVTATKETRIEFKKVFLELAKKKYNVSMSTIQGLQDAASNPAETCSDDFKGTIALAKQNQLVMLLCQLLNMPVTDEDLAIHCKKFGTYMKDKSYGSYAELLVKEGVLRPQTAEEIAAEPKVTVKPSETIAVRALETATAEATTATTATAAPRESATTATATKTTGGGKPKKHRKTSKKSNRFSLPLLLSSLSLRPRSRRVCG